MNTNRNSLNRLLLVEDNPDDSYINIRKILRAGIVDDRSAIAVVENGDEALRYLSDCLDSGVPEWVLLDLNMPSMGGFEFLERFSVMREGGALEQVKVAILTSSESLDDEQRGNVFPFVRSFLTKPIDTDKLSALIEDAS